MPTLQRFGRSSIRMYADDHHPPHFHIVGTSFEVLVRLPDMAIIAGRARQSDIAEALAWALINLPALDAAWAALNERA